MIIFLCYSSAGFNPIANAMSPEGQPNNANSLEACRQQCEASFTYCLSFDYDPNKATKCYLHYSQKNIATSQGVTHYIRVGKLHKLTKSQASFSLKRQTPYTWFVICYQVYLSCLFIIRTTYNKKEITVVDREQN